MKSEIRPQDIEVIILAGGLGTRLRSAIGEIPKPMAPFEGRPFLDYLIDYWIKQGIQHFILSVAYKHELIEVHFGSKWHGATIDYALDEGWGTGGGVVASLSKRKKNSGPFLVINGDTYFEVPCSEFLKFHQSKKSQATLALFNFPDAPGFGRVKIDADCKIASFNSLASDSNWINGGIYLFESDFFNQYQGPKSFSLEKDLLTKTLTSNNPCYGFPCEGRFRDIGTPDSYRSCAELFKTIHSSPHAHQ